MDRLPALIAASARGDEIARETILEFVRPRVVAWCAARLPLSLRGQCDSEDVAQDVLIAAHAALAAFRGESSAQLWAWLFRIAENRILDLTDRAGALKRRLPTAASFSQTSPSGAARRNERASRVMDAVGTLADDYRTVIRLFRIEERSAAETAAEMGRSENAVRVLYCRALKALREAIPGEP